VRDGHHIERVLQVHTRYRQAGGEDAVVTAEKDLLESAGVTVEQLIFDNADLRDHRSPVADVGLALAAVSSSAARRRVRAALEVFRPQVMHVHNTFVVASPSVYEAAMGRIPVVQTLHNYRFVCPAATVFRDGHACTDCVGRPVPWPSVLHACVRGSRSQSLVAAATITFHRARGTYSRGIAMYLTLTRFQRRLMIGGGLPADRIRVISNFLEPDPGPGMGDRAGILYAGRLSPEKGIPALLDAAARVPGTISIIGDGPLADEVARAHVAGSVRYLGSEPRHAALGRMRDAVALVVPSVWYEGLPLVVLEAFASGTPVIASRIGSLEELVEDGVTGLHALPNDAADLATRIAWALDHPREMRAMGANARRAYEDRYRGKNHLASLLEAYAAVVDADEAA
jgi:glycosyltransferase involved in cell wall biosynthesis